MLIAPARLSDLALRLWHRVQSFLVFIKNETVRVVTDRMCLDLNSFLQCLSQHRRELFVFDAEKTFAVRLVAVRLQQSSATRTERAVGNNFDRAQIESIAKRFDDRTFAQKPLRFFTWTRDSFINPQLQFSFAIKFFVEIDVAIAAARILNLR